MQACSQHHTKWGKTETISFKVRNEKRVSTPSTHIRPRLGISSQSNKTGKRNKRNTNMKERNLSIFVDDMILYLEDPK
jgi:hypothetical protein